MTDTLDNKPEREGEPRKLGDVDMAPVAEAEPVTDTDVVDTTSLDEPVIGIDMAANEYFAEAEEAAALAEPVIPSEEHVGFVAAMSAVDVGMRVRRDSWKNAGAQILFHPHIPKLLVIDFTKYNPSRFQEYVLTDDDKEGTDWVILDV